MRVIIIGAGIGGLATALALRQVGHEVTVYERADELTEVGAGISLWANALRALDVLGRTEAIQAACLPMTQSEFRVGQGHSIVGRFSAHHFEERFGYSPFVAMIHRADLISALASGLPSEMIRCGHECTAAQSGSHSVQLRFQTGHQDEADVVIGADGLRSALRRLLFSPEQPRYSGYTCWRGICPRPSSIVPGYIAEWWGRGQRLGITTLPGDRVYWWATKNEPMQGRAPQEQEYLQQAFGDWVAPVPELLASTPANQILRNDIFDRLPNRHWVEGRAVLLGDAAHPTTPNFGQGGCLAIEDAVVLARCLHGPSPVESQLNAFVAERFPRTAEITRESWRFGRIGQWQGPVSCWLRDRVMKVLLPLLGTRTLPKYAAYDVGSLAIARSSN